MTHADIRTRVLERIEADPTDLQWQAAATAAINEGQTLFAFLTLCLESVVSFSLTPGTAFYHMLGAFDDWLLPLRIYQVTPTAGGSTLYDETLGDDQPYDQPGDAAITRTKLRPATASQMAAEDSGFLNVSGSATRYGSLGWDLLFLNRKPTAGQQLEITYARSSQALVNDGDVPEIHDADHEVLIDYGVARLRANEGGQELTTASELMKGFLAAAKKRAEQVRERSLAQGYDKQPAELDLSQNV